VRAWSISSTVRLEESREVESSIILKPNVHNAAPVNGGERQDYCGKALP
jgi:hypothetical protein